jgi:esterase/lipase
MGQPKSTSEFIALANGIQKKKKKDPCNNEKTIPSILDPTTVVESHNEPPVKPQQKVNGSIDSKRTTNTSKWLFIYTQSTHIHTNAM